jgi:hypothetical protein
MMNAYRLEVGLATVNTLDLIRQLVSTVCRSRGGIHPVVILAEFYRRQE